MEAFVDWQAFQRLDNASVVDFLTSTAGALCEKGVLTAKDADNLRLVLSGVLPECHDRPVLLELHEQSAEILAVLEARYGSMGFCLNLMRHTLRGHVAESHRVLADWGQALLKRSELLFNRPARVVSGGEEQKLVVASTLLVDFSETLADACAMLEQALAELSRMNPHAMGGTAPDDEEIDLAVATALGFKGLVSHSLPAHAELCAKRRVASAFELVADGALEVAEQLQANRDVHQSAPGQGVAVACEWLSAECQRLSLLEFPRTVSLLAWEVRRRNLIAALAGINEAMRMLVRASLEALSVEAFRTLVDTRLPEGARRRVTFDLIRSGIPAAKARAAATDLLQYLADHKLRPQALLPAELAKINPLLTPSALSTLTTLVDAKALMTDSSREKSTTRARAVRLQGAFAKSLETLAVLALFVLFPLVSGCGLKTRPQSDIDDFRPDIPFRSESRNPVDSPADVPDTP